MTRMRITAIAAAVAVAAALPATAQAAYPWVTKQERIHDTVDGSSVSVSAHLYTRHTHAYRLVVIIDDLTALDAGPSHVSASFTQTCHHAGIKRHSKLTRSTSEAVEGLAFRAKAPAAVSGGVCDLSWSVTASHPGATTIRVDVLAQKR